MACIVLTSVTFVALVSRVWFPSGEEGFFRPQGIQFSCRLLLQFRQDMGVGVPELRLSASGLKAPAHLLLLLSKKNSLPSRILPRLV